jgi:alpha-aminoadipic semialdehyde synthase
VVQPSDRRAFADEDYAGAGAVVSEELEGCGLVLGVKEVPADKLVPGIPHVFFSHVFKGQAYNMPMLRRLMDLKCSLVDYEMIADRHDRRLVFFGRHAGYAGMIDGLWALGQRLAWEGHSTPLEEIRMAHQYSGLEEALTHLSRIGDRIRHRGLSPSLRPAVVAFLGSGNVSRGAQEVFERLPFQELDPEELPSLNESADAPRNLFFKVCLDRCHRVRRADGGPFSSEDYRANPGRYESALGPMLPHVTLLVNGIFWEGRRPVLVTREQLLALSEGEEQPKLRVIADITCDIDGAIAATVRSTEPGDPVYLYDPRSGETAAGVAGRGFVVMAVDNLPCELPVEASEHFGDSLIRFLPPLVRCDWGVPLEGLALPPELLRAVIVHRGQLTPPYAYLEQHLAGPAEGL